MNLMTHNQHMHLIYAIIMFVQLSTAHCSQYSPTTDTCNTRCIRIQDILPLNHVFFCCLLPLNDVFYFLLQTGLMHIQNKYKCTAGITEFSTRINDSNIMLSVQMVLLSLRISEYFDLQYSITTLLSDNICQMNNLIISKLFYISIYKTQIKVLRCHLSMIVHMPIFEIYKLKNVNFYLIQNVLLFYKYFFVFYSHISVCMCSKMYDTTIIYGNVYSYSNVYSDRTYSISMHARIE